MGFVTWTGLHGPLDRTRGKMSMTGSGVCYLDRTTRATGQDWVDGFGDGFIATQQMNDDTATLCPRQNRGVWR